MNRLNEQLHAVVKEYTRQTAELLGVNPKDVYWIGTDDNGNGTYTICDMGDVTFLSLDQMQVIIDNLPKWQEKWGSREAVAEQVQAWLDWSIQDESLVDERPRINLEHWLMGAPREPQDPTPQQRLYARIAQTTADIETLKRLIETYRDTRSMGNVLQNLKSELAELSRQEELQTKEDIERMKQSPEYGLLKDCIERHEEEY